MVFGDRRPNCHESRAGSRSRCRRDRRGADELQGYRFLKTRPGFARLGANPQARCWSARGHRQDIARPRHARDANVPFFTIGSASCMFSARRAPRARLSHRPIRTRRASLIAKSRGRPNRAPSRQRNDEREQTPHRVWLRWRVRIERRHIILAATNRPRLTRAASPGGSSPVVVPLPDIDGRENILPFNEEVPRRRTSTPPMARHSLSRA